AEDGIRDLTVTGVQTCALPISVSTRSYRGNFAADFKPFLRETAATDACLLAVEQFNLPSHPIRKCNQSTRSTNGPVVQQSDELIEKPLSPGHSCLNRNEFAVAKKGVSDLIENFPVKPCVFQLVRL